MPNGVPEKSVLHTEGGLMAHKLDCWVYRSLSPLLSSKSWTLQLFPVCLSILLTAVGFAPLWAPSGWSKAPAQKKGSEGSGSTTCGRSRALRAQTCSKNWKHLIEALFLHIWTCSELNLIPFHIGLQPLLQCRKRSPGLWRPEGDEHVSKILIWKMLRSISICFYFNAKYTENIQKVGTLSVRSETCLPESWPSRNAGAQWSS